MYVHTVPHANFLCTIAAATRVRELELTAPHAESYPADTALRAAAQGLHPEASRIFPRPGRCAE